MSFQEVTQTGPFSQATSVLTGCWAWGRANLRARRLRLDVAQRRLLTRHCGKAGLAGGAVVALLLCVSLDLGCLSPLSQRAIPIASRDLHRLMLPQACKWQEHAP